MKKVFLFLALSLLTILGAQAATINLSTLPSSTKTKTLNNGDIVTGKLNHDVAIKIAANATVTFYNANINGDRDLNAKSSHAGVACNGNATIILKGNNYICGSKGRKPAIFIPEGYTLTIREDAAGGYLKARSGWDSKDGEHAAAIGAKSISDPYYPYVSYNPDCGNIIIQSGHIVANGGNCSAAIGSSMESNCGNIRIEGGKVEAYSGSRAAAIGSGAHLYQGYLPDRTLESKCGNIEIVGGEVIAYSGTNAAAIGGGSNGKCGNITITDFHNTTSIYAECTDRNWYSIGEGRGTISEIGTITVMGGVYSRGVSENPYIYPTNTTPEPEIEPEATCATQPTNVTVSNRTHNSATISWSNHQDGDIYYVRYYPAANDASYSEKSTTTNPYVLTGLQPNTSYRVYVVHECANGRESTPSNTVTFTTTQQPTTPATAEIYTVFQDGVLTYYYDANKSSRSGIVEVYNPTNPGVRFTTYADQITEAVIDPSMGSVALTSTQYMFYGGQSGSGRGATYYRLTNLTHITGLEYLYMYYVTNAVGMFKDLSSLEELDLSTWEMYTVENLTEMFSGCSSLTDINIGMWELWNANQIVAMFYGCTNLRAIYCNKDFSIVSLAVTSDDVFSGCTNLIGGQGTEFNSSNTTHIYARPDEGSSRRGYFTAYNCDAPHDLQALDITTNSAKLTWTPGTPFQYAWEIHLIKQGVSGWTDITVWSPEVNFTDLEPNTTYQVTITGECGKYMNSMMATYEFTTMSIPAKIYAMLNGSTMTLYYDSNPTSHDGVVMTNWKESWGSTYVTDDELNLVTNIVLDESIKDARPTSTKSWFLNLPNLTTIEHLDYLNTSEVTNMHAMFALSPQLTELDLRTFDMSKVTDVSGMFADCTSLHTIYCEEDWNQLSQLTTHSAMFYGCTSLVGGKGTAYDIYYTDGTYARPDEGPSSNTPGYFWREGDTGEDPGEDPGTEPGGGFVFPENTIWSEDFESDVFPEGWITPTTNWSISSGDHRDLTSAHSGIENLLHYVQSYGSVDTLYTPIIDLSGYEDVQLNFYLINAKYGNDLDFLEVFYRNAPDADWTSLTGLIDSEFDDWTLNNASIPNPSATCQLAIVAHGNYGYGIALDDIYITGTATEDPEPTCFIPWDVRVTDNTSTSATVTFNPGSEDQTMWVVYCYNQDEGVVYSDYIFETSVIIEDLQPNTEYMVKVKAKCGETVSDWSPEIPFTTLEETGIEKIYEGQMYDVRSQKILHDGHLLLIRPDGAILNASGTRLK